MAKSADKTSTFYPETLAAELERCPGKGRWVVGFSGGADSTALLLALKKLNGLGRDILAVHVHHALQDEADQWAEACADFANRLGVKFVCAHVQIEKAGKGLEAAAREARYAVLAEYMHSHDVLLTAHHRRDQAETLLLQLLRGAGPAGLASMSRYAPFGPGWHARPLLDCAPESLRSWLQEQGIEWIEDPSNRSVEPRRNFLRHQVLPVLQTRWPQMEKQLAAAADRQAETQHLLHSLGSMDLQECAGLEPATLQVSALLRLERLRLHNAIRSWLLDKGLPMPPAKRLQRLREDVLLASGDASPVLRWAGGEIRRYRDTLYAMEPLPPHDPASKLLWEAGAPAITLPPDGRRLSQYEIKTDLDSAWREGMPVSVRFRTGGERCRPTGSQQHRELKKLFQEAGIPPWMRDRIPLLYIGERLVEVIDYYTCA